MEASGSGQSGPFLNGLLLVDKPIGMTSHDVVHKVRRVLGERGIGHAGTLDPLASGLLVLLVGEATKISDYLLNGDKVYEGRVQLGIVTDTMDTDGKVLETRPVTAEPREIAKAAEGLSGEIDLSVPIFSAVKVAGKKLYEMAHKGETPISVPVRKMGFFDVKVIDQGADWISVRMRCSKGSFVRAWAQELGRRLGCGGAISALRRVKSEPFSLDQALSLPDLEAKWSARSSRNGEVLGPAWVPLRDALPHFAMVQVGGNDAFLLQNGQIPKAIVAELLRLTQGSRDQMRPARVVSRESGELLAILVAAPGEFYKIKRVFRVN